MTTTTEAARNNLGEDIDTLDNLIGALQLPLPPSMHVEQLKRALPELCRAMKQHYAEALGENPWSTHT